MIAKNIQAIRKEIGESTTLVAVSKTHSVEKIQEAYNAGQRVFGENRVQELCDKSPQLPKDIQWHLIGHLQRNKVKYIAPFVSMIHAVDSWRLLKEINKQATKNDRTIECLLQFHIAEEDSKFGLSQEDAIAFLDTPEFEELCNIEICGVMGMATLTENEEQIRSEFAELANIFHTLKGHFFKLNPNFKEISMGMSSDYKIAVEEGSTMVRVGSKIFGERD